MAEFKWDEDNADPMDGFDTDPDPEPTPVVAQPVKPAPKAQLPKLPKAQPAQNKMAQVIEELENSPDPAELTEAEWRLEKAQFYRAVINSQLLSSDHEAAVEVEEELQQWAKEQLETLLGLRTKGGVPAEKVVHVESPFTEEETAVLKQLVAKVQSRATTPSPPPVQNKEPTPVAIQPVTTRPQPAVRAVTSGPTNGAQETRRGRGRPRKNPCRMCGKMECEHKRTQPTQSTQQAPVPQGKKSNAPATGEVYDGLPIQLMADGTKFIETADGRKYKLEIRQVTHKETGQVRDAYVPIELSQVKKTAAAKPYPSENEAMQLAAEDAARNAGAMERLTGATSAMGAPMRFSGADLVKAAMATPEREAYIPEAPARKR